MRNSSRGFTLIELLVVVAIVGILTSIAVGQYAVSITKAREAVLKENLFRMRSAIQMYFADKTRYPAELGDLVTERYLRKIPVDTITESAETWVVTYVQPTEMDLFKEVGVYDVFSGANGNGIDGTPYAEW